MAIDCDHPRPELNLPQSTPPQLGWQVPSYLSPDPNEFRRQVLAALEGIYLEQSKRFAQPAVLPLFDDFYDLAPGQVVRGVANGQVLNLLPPALGNNVDPVTVILTGVESPVSVVSQGVDGEAVETVLNAVGAYSFFPDENGGYQQGPGDALVGAGGPTLTQVLTNGNTSGANDALWADGQFIGFGGGTLPAEGELRGAPLSGIFQIRATDNLKLLGEDSVLIQAALTTMILASAGTMHLHSSAGLHLGHTGTTTSVDVEASGPVSISTAGALRLAIAADGAWTVDGSEGTAGQFLVSQGISAPPQWVTVAPFDTADIPVASPILNTAGTIGFDQTVALGNVARTTIRTNTGANAGSRRRLNLIGGSNVTISAVDDSLDEEVDITVSATDTTYTAGDGVDLTGTTLSADVSDFAGATLEDDGANNLRISAAAAGNGLTGGGASALAVGQGDGITVNANDVAVFVSDFAGTGLENDGVNNLRISTAAAGGGLGGGGGSALFVESSLDSNARIGVRRNSTGSTLLRRRLNLIEGSNVTISIADDAGSEEVDLTIAATDTDTTYSAGDGIDISGGNSVSVDVTDIIDGVSIEEVATNNIRRAALTGDVTASAGSNTTAIAAGAIVNADVSDTAAIGMSKTGALTGEVTKPSGGSTLSITRSTSFTWTGSHSHDGNLAAGAIFRLSGSVNVAAGNNVSIGTSSSVVRITSGTTMTGMVPSGSNHVALLVNTTGATVSVIKESGSSSAANRFGGSSSTILILEGDLILCWYDGSSSRWRCSRGFT